MRELQHYAVWEEALALVREVSEALRLRLIPEEPQLASPDIVTYDRFEPEVGEKLSHYRVLELEGAFTRHPLVFRRRETGSAAGTHYIDFNTGPRIRWTLPAVNTTGRPTLTPGVVSHLSSYRGPDGRPEPASEALQQAFAAVVATMKQRLVHATVGKSRAWIGRDTKLLLDQGKVFLDL